MDRNYLLIIVIIIFCCFNLHFIANNSDIVGSASVNVKNFTFSIPKGTEVLNTYDNYVDLRSTTDDFYSKVRVLNNNDYNFTKIVEDIGNKSENNILSNGTINVDDIVVDCVYYKSEINGRVQYSSSFFFIKDNTAFSIAISTSNPDYRNLTIDFVTYVVSTLRINHKKWCIKYLF